MLSLRRLLIVCLLALALPVQGLAAVVMMHCAGEPALQAPQPGQLQLQMQEHSHHHQHAHGPADTAAELDAAVAAEDSGQSAPASQQGHGCSACASCCVAMGLPSQAQALGLLLHSQAPALAAHADLPAFLTEGPERPPRARPQA